MLGTGGSELPDFSLCKRYGGYQNSFGLPRPLLPLGGVRQYPGVVGLLNHRHLLVAAVRGTDHVHALVAGHEVTILAPPPQNCLHLEASELIHQQYGRSQ